MVHGVVAVVVRGGRFLVVRRAAGVVAPGAWCFVGGAVEPGESEPQAVVREFREELGAAIRPLRRVWEYLRPDGGLRLGWWMAALDAAELRPNPAEVAELRWCGPAALERLPGLLESNRLFLQAAGRALAVADAPAGGGPRARGADRP